MAVSAPKQSTRPGRPSRTATYVVLGLAILAAGALIVGAQLFRGGSSPRSSGTAGIDFSGIPQGGTTLGSPGAKVTLIEFADIQCPACRYYSVDLFPTVVNEYVRTGKVKTEFHGYPFLGSDSFKGERFLLAAAEQNKMWQLMDALYKKQGPEESGWLTDETIRELASRIPGLDVNKLFARAQSAEIGQLAQRTALASQNEMLKYLDRPGTPTLLVKIGNADPYLVQVGTGTPDQVRAALDDALSG